MIILFTNLKQEPDIFFLIQVFLLIVFLYILWYSEFDPEIRNYDTHRHKWLHDFHIQCCYVSSGLEFFLPTIRLISLFYFVFMHVAISYYFLKCQTTELDIYIFHRLVENKNHQMRLRAIRMWIITCWLLADFRSLTPFITVISSYTVIITNLLHYFMGFHKCFEATCSSLKSANEYHKTRCLYMHVNNRCTTKNN